jgi:hypothetical protein
MVNKKNKRLSLVQQSTSLSAAVSPKMELIERTPDNDYGVLSDPDEQTTSVTEAQVQSQSQSQSQPQETTTTTTTTTTTEAVGHECSYNQNERFESSHSLHSSAQSSPLSSPQLSPLAQEPDLSIQPSISQNQASNQNKSLETLKLKLTRDKNFSRKITLHTFFSYIILAMEIQRSCSASIAQLDLRSVQDLIVYMIDNHTVSNPVRIYLHTLNDTGVVKNIIESIIEFNRDNKSSSIETLYTHEENELEICILQSANTSSQSSATATATAVNDVKLDAAETSHHNSPQTSQKCGFFKRMRCCLFSGCCG